MEIFFWKMACFLEFDYDSENNLEKIESFGFTWKIFNISCKHGDSKSHGGGGCSEGDVVKVIGETLVVMMVVAVGKWWWW